MSLYSAAHKMDIGDAFSRDIGPQLKHGQTPPCSAVVKYGTSVRTLDQHLYGLEVN
jgi:hypothetical protein